MGTPEDIQQLAFDLGFRRELPVGIKPPQRRSFHQKHVDIAGRIGDKPLKQCAFTAMRPEIPGIEEALSACLDLQRVGVIGGMIHQMRRHGEWAEDQWCLA